MAGFVRIHILVFILIAFGATQLFLNKKIKLFSKILLIGIMICAAMIVYPLFLQRIGFSADISIVSQVQMLESKSLQGGSTVNMTNKSMLIKYPS